MTITDQVNTMRTFGFLGAIAAVLALVGCGGNDPSSFASLSSSSSSSSGGTSTVASITLVSSLPQIPSNDSSPATITAIAKNAANAIVTGANVTFSTNANATIAPTTTSATGSMAGITDTNGEAQAILTTPGDYSNRTVTVTASVGTVSASIDVAVVGTQLSLTGPTSLIQGANGTFSASLTNSGGTGIPQQTITVASANNNTLSASTLTTDATGHVQFMLTATNSGTDTVSVSALGASASQSVVVSSQTFNFKSPAANTSVAIGAAQTVTVVWLNHGAPVANQPVSFSTTRGLFTGGTTTVSATTDSTGTATAILSSNTAGPAVITASGAAVSAELTLAFFATNPSQIDVQASPTTVPASGSSNITAIVRDAQGNLVSGVTVDFQLTDRTGGSISVGSAVTNAQGVASTVYTATTTASAANGVTITGTVQGTTLQSTVDMTVGGQTLFLSLGTGNTITAPNATQFSMPFTVQALDSGGNPVTNVTIAFTVHSFPYEDIPAADFYADAAVGGDVVPEYAAYAKGFWIDTPTTLPGACNGITGTAFCQVINAYCFNEDLNGSGVNSPSEDINGVDALWPADVASVSPASGATDTTGTVSLAVLYPQDHAGWVRVKLTATATVAGTQSSTDTVFWLPMLAADVNSSSNGTPPGYISPYGYANTCTNPN
jgi:hypothetical protein